MSFLFIESRIAIPTSPTFGPKAHAWDKQSKSKRKGKRKEEKRDEKKDNEVGKDDYDFHDGSL